METAFTKRRIVQRVSPRAVAAIYFRVSTLDQSTGIQETDLRRYAEARGLTVFKEYRDHAVSGAKDRRPALDMLMDDARKRRFDVIVVWRFDRFARSTTHLHVALDEFKALGISFVSYNENLDTSTAMGKAMFSMIAAMSELERSMIRERVTAGVRRAIKTRAKIGKSWGRAKVEQADPKKAERITQLRREGISYHAIAQREKVSSRTVWRLLQRGKAEKKARK
jgi:DNA invertase Pin-like site-specific DNA recombinase